MRALRSVALLVVPLALAGCDWVKSVLPGAKETPAAAADKVEVTAQGGGAGEQIVTIDTEGPAATTAGATPMAERVAVLGLLNKRNGAARDITLKPGQAVRAGDVIIRLRACERTAAWESEQYTGAFAQVDVRESSGQWKRHFSGWLYKERPSLNVVPHPIYDVWVKSCAMTFPETGGAPASEGAAARSSAPKSAPVSEVPKSGPASPSASDKSDR